MPKGLPPVILIDDNVEFAGLLGTLIAEQNLMPVLAHTAEDGVRMLEAYPHAVALVADLLLPDLTGQKLLARLIKKGVRLPPVFIITGVFKGVGQQEKVRKVCDYAGWFEKPFDTRVLVERIVTTAGLDLVVRDEHQRVGKVTDVDIKILDPNELDSIVASKPPAATKDLGIGSSDLDVDRDLELDIEVETPGFDPAENLTEVATRRPAPRAISGLHSWSVDDTPTPAMVSEGLRRNLRSGDLQDTTVPALIHAFYIAQETGEIVFERGKQRKILYVDQGCPVFAVSNQDADRFGRAVAQVKSVSERDLARAIERAKKSNRTLGDVLLAQGQIDRPERDRLVQAQTKQILRSLFTWTTGRYVIGFKPRTQFSVDMPQAEHPAGLILAGVRDLFELSRLQSLIPDDLKPQPSPNPPFALYELALRDEEALLLLRTTGARTVRTLCEEMGGRLSEQGVLAVLYALLTLGVLVAGKRD